jgi:hypothetical protein
MTQNIKKLNLIINKKVFILTGTSEILTEVAKKIIKPKI